MFSACLTSCDRTHCGGEAVVEVDDAITTDVNPHEEMEIFSPALEKQREADKKAASQQSSSPSPVDTDRAGSNGQCATGNGEDPGPAAELQSPACEPEQNAGTKLEASEATKLEASEAKSPTVPSLAHSNTTQSEALRQEHSMMLQLANAKDPPRIWMRESVQRWNALPLGDGASGTSFFEAAYPMTSVYPWVFHMNYAVNYLTKDFQTHVAVAKERWPKGATTLREAVRGEVKSMGNVEKVEKAYWNTCTVRILWIFLMLKMFMSILNDLCHTNKSPVESAKSSIEQVMGQYMNYSLRKVAGFICSMCVFRKRDKLFLNIGVSEQELKGHMGVLARSLRPHVEFLESMLLEEVPTVVSKRPP